MDRAIVSRRAFAYASALLIVFGIALTSAGARVSRRAAFILDANTSAVLHNIDADTPRHPASLTKMMTFYLTFETLQSGRLRMSDKLTISEHAAAAAPSKLDLDPHDQISVADAIKAIVTKSANDVAVALAEKIGGTETNFARLMNAHAREFGMTGTHYKNASGLPNVGQITTARDTATLALHLQDDFPQYYPLFSTRAFAYAGKSYLNHNTMLNTFAGVDGIKTGYTRASGFNLVTSWHCGNRHLIGVIFGGDTAGERNAEMQKLLTRTLPRASPIKTRKPIMLARLRRESRFARRPNRRRQKMTLAQASRLPPVRGEAPKMATVEYTLETPVHLFKVRTVPIMTNSCRQVVSPDKTTDTEGSGRVVTPVRKVLITEASELRRAEPTLVHSFTPVNLVEPYATSTVASARHVRHVVDHEQPQPLHANRILLLPQMVTSAEIHAPPVIQDMPPSTIGAQVRALGAGAGEERHSASQAPRGKYTVQIGAYSSIDGAQRALTNVQNCAGRLLAGMSSVTSPTMKNGHQIFRARFTGFDVNRATSTCKALRRQSADCFVMASE